MTSFPATPVPFPPSGKERGWSPITRAQFDAQLRPDGALLVGNAEEEEVVEKIVRYNEAPGGLMRAIYALGSRVAPALRDGLADD